MTRPLQVHLSGRKFKRQVLVMKMALLALEEGPERVSLSTLVERTVQYGASLTPPIREGEAESMLVLVLEHLM